MRGTIVPALALSALTACTGRLEAPPGSDGLQPPSAVGSGGTSGGGTTSVGAATDPGRVTLRRLNRAEYDNSVRDLLGTSLTPARDFPIDDRGGGFDNMADVLTLSPLHLSVYLTAAKALVSEALGNPAQRAKILSCDLAAEGEACAKGALRAFAYRAWRRPVTDDELARLTATLNVALAHGDGHEQGLTLALRAVLLSPNFVFRVELDPVPTSGEPHPLSPYELASRLSYFLWSSTPDDELLESAASGALSTPSTLQQQTTRLLADTRARALIDNFAGQWLHLRAIETLQPDPTAFPDVDAGLLEAMRRESERLVQDIAFEGTPLLALLTANYGYVNDRLAAHYGLPPVGSTELVRVDFTANAERGGLLSQAGFLSLTSHPERTSPVLRGKWVIDELLCASVPPPPPDVDLGAVSMASQEGLTQREALERHRADPKCFGCHQMMDPIGLGLENYDAVGVYRTTDAGRPIDAAGELPSGATFAGTKELSARIAETRDFARCAARKLYTYALGRPPQDVAGHLDGPTLEALTQSLIDSGYSFNDLITRIVQSPTFTQRRGEPVGGLP